MKDNSDKAQADKKPGNKATMDQPQEEFIEPDAAHVTRDDGDVEANKKTKVMPAKD